MDLSALIQKNSVQIVADKMKMLLRGGLAVLYYLFFFTWKPLGKPLRCILL
jgi:hypothetical protein